MAFLNQSRFPTLFQFFQTWLGGTQDKQKLALLKYQNQKRIMEVGCSVGNIAYAFRQYDDIEYTGIDIDPVVIDHAQKAFAGCANFQFVCQDLKTYQLSGDPFDFILFAGVCHHMPDEECQVLLSQARKLLAQDGQLVVVDILQPEPEDSWLLQQYIKIDQGEYIRSDASLQHLIKRVASIQNAEIHYVGASPMSIPIIARFGVYTLAPLGS